ncbi:hypothetical protein Q7A53_00885 [Halobacillus rhizosphaerae]|uniref:hypothetical protein n=1 Tax=Halobacillus rhizosphaerae TaxID=3064889 RepID=UPI00398B389C
MSRLKNENGAALVFVLFVIVVVGLLTTVIAFQITSTGKQVAVSQQTVQAEDLAGMGKELLIQSIEKINAQYSTQKEVKKAIEQEWGRPLVMNMESKDSVTHSYQVTASLANDLGNHTLTIHYESKGLAGDREKLLQGEVTLDFSQTEESTK